MTGALHLAIVTPVYNDWVSLSHLIPALEAVLAQHGHTADLYAVDDGSTDDRGLPTDLGLLSALRRVEVVRLRRNVGHQRAIAMGLVVVAASAYPNGAAPSAVIVLDADGEDRPAALPELLMAFSAQLRPSIVVASRARRTETRVFRGFYVLYKRMFRALVGFNIDFGNFCLLPFSDLDGLVYDPNLWNHFAATLLRSKRPMVRLSVDRGRRYDGSSKMNFTSLVIHGLSALSVYFDIIITRILIMVGILMGLAGTGIALVVGIVLFTELAIPGWATTAVGFLTLFILQMLLFSGLSIFVLLYTRTHQLVVPARDMLHLVRRQEVLHGGTDQR
ncbi:MAG: glycosyltransferase [Anaerolineae bacterium]|jgi:glycosyltransferase involved in cell wall biosynthesis|nr:glycosyltransferase [Anaerolineae bacterium]